MKYIDNGVVYISVGRNTTQEEMDKIRKQHFDKTVVFLRSGKENMEKILLNFIVPR